MDWETAKELEETGRGEAETSVRVVFDLTDKDVADRRHLHGLRNHGSSDREAEFVCMTCDDDAVQLAYKRYPVCAKHAIGRYAEYTKWLNMVDSVLIAATGEDTYSLPDNSYYDMFEARMSPRNAARDTLANDGMEGLLD